MSLRISQPIAVCNISGWWKDPRHPDTFHARAVAPHSCLNDSATCTFAVDMSSAGLGTPFGNYNATTTNQTLWLQFASGTRSTGQLATTACNLLVWTDAPDRKAGNTWCRVASSAGGACIAAVGPSLLSSPRRMLAAASVGKYSLFAGGFDVSNVASAAVDIFVNGSRIATHTLSQPRGLLAATALSERYVLFAGGQDASGNKSDVVDIFDALTLTWSVAKLSLPRSMLAATSAGEIALFAGGELSEHEGNTSTADDTDRVDLYDSRDGTWSTASLSIARKKLAATSLDDVALFAGGYLSAAGPRAEWDAYDAVSGAWSRGNLSAPRMRLQAASAGGAALFIGGMGDGTTQGCGADCNVVDLCPLWSKGLRKWSVQHLQRGFVQHLIESCCLLLCAPRADPSFLFSVSHFFFLSFFHFFPVLTRIVVAMSSQQ